MSKRYKILETEQQHLLDRYRSILQTSMDGVWRVDMQGRVVEVNSTYCTMCGYSEQELLNMNIADLEAQESVGDISDHALKIFEQGEDRFETRHRRKDGSVFDVEISVRYLPGQPDQMVAFLRDITQRKQAEEKLWNEKAFLRCIIDSASDLIYIKDINSVYLGCNRASEIFTGLQECDQIGKNDFDLLDHDTAVLCRERDQTVLAGKKAVHAEEWVTYPDGHKVLLDTLKTPIFDKKGQPVGLVGISRDITDRKQMENALRESENRYRSLMENIPAIVYKYSIRHGGMFYSPQVEQVFDYPLQAFYENPLLWKSSIHPDDVGAVESAITRTCEHGEEGVYVEYRVRNRSGTWVWLRDNLIQREIGSAGIELFGIAIDITERKRAEEERLLMEAQFQHTQKLESLGVLAGGIAHDFNNILAIITGHCSLAQLRPESAPERITIIENAAERAAELCRQMLAYAGKTEFIQSRIDMRELVDEMVRMLKSTISRKVTITQDISDDIPNITGDASQIRQIVMNLIINATEAIGNAYGEIKIALQTSVIRAEEAEKDHLGNTMSPGRYLCLEISDNGCGMDETTRRRIFEPFYTTKFTGRGLGLSATLGIITSHAGMLQLTSQTGRGTTFKVYLQVQDPDSRNESHLDHTDSLEQWQGVGTILLVEDEEMIEQVARAMLEELGFSVITVKNGREALDLYQQKSDVISMVVTDMGLPVMDGYELVCELKKLRPELPIVISSGFGDTEVSSRLERSIIAGFISKPYGFDQLRETMQNVLENQGGILPLYSPLQSR